MKHIHNSFTDLIGGTPLLALSNYKKALSLEANLIAKLEYFNPAGSVKDRIAATMIQEAEKNGQLKKGATIIEPTSGNTGIGLAAVAASKGYRLILTMPETMSLERRKLLAAYGADVVLTDGAKGMSGAIEKAKELTEETEGSFMPSQFENSNNPKAHIASTGPEIWRDMDGEIDIFVAGVGTGGTITGVGQYLKEKNPAIKVVAVESENSSVLSGGKAGPHKLQGLGAGFIPKILDTALYDEVVAINDEKAFETSQLLAKKEGILTGISSGAALYAATIVARRPENKGKNLVVLLPDTGERYLTTELF